MENIYFRNFIISILSLYFNKIEFLFNIFTKSLTNNFKIFIFSFSELNDDIALSNDSSLSDNININSILYSIYFHYNHTIGKYDSNNSQGY